MEINNERVYELANNPTSISKIISFTGAVLLEIMSGVNRLIDVSKLVVYVKTCEWNLLTSDISASVVVLKVVEIFVKCFH